MTWSSQILFFPSKNEVSEIGLLELNSKYKIVFILPQDHFVYNSIFCWAVGFRDTDSISRTKKVREKLKRQKSRQIEWGQFRVSRFFSIESDFLLVILDFLSLPIQWGNYVGFNFFSWKTRIIELVIILTTCHSMLMSFQPISACFLG